MRALITGSIVAMAFGVTAAAQDSTVTTQTKVSGEDARAVTMRGCLQAGSTGFQLQGAVAASGAKTSCSVCADGAVPAGLADAPNPHSRAHPAPANSKLTTTVPAATTFAARIARLLISLTSRRRYTIPWGRIG